MDLLLPICCDKQAFESLSEVCSCMEAPDSLVAGAVAIARHEMPEADAVAIQARLQLIATTISNRVQSSQPRALIAHLHEYLFDELRFTGNSTDYYSSNNSLLPWVLEHRRGLPITLSLIYKTVARNLGLSVWGVGLPGHFLVGVDFDGKPTWLDPFAAGRIITLPEAQNRLVSQFGRQVLWNDALAEPVNNRFWLTRMLQNLLTAYSRKSDYQQVAAMLEMELLLWPDETRLQRDLALVLARVGMGSEAVAWLDLYLQNNPDDPQRADLKQLLASLV